MRMVISFKMVSLFFISFFLKVCFFFDSEDRSFWKELVIEESISGSVFKLEEVSKVRRGKNENLLGGSIYI